MPDATSDLGIDAVADTADTTQLDAPAETSVDSGVDSMSSGRCTTNLECAAQPERPVCDVVTGLCVACLATPMDTCPTGRYCDPGRRCVPGCRDDGECVGRGAALRCDLVLHACVGCIADLDCALGTVCSEGTCVPGCSSRRGCPMGESCCVSSCQALGSDRLNCGACGHACATGESCCGGRCVVTAMDSMHCGGCGMMCSLPNATPVCASGSCAATACATGFGDCDQSASNGCEVSLDNNLNHCGACGRMCPGGPNATAVCTRGACGLRCDPGSGDCDGDPTNGCETDLNSTPTACSACTTVCTAPNALPSCAMGRCGIGSCVPGFGDCDGLVVNGCETATTTNTNCGRCGTVCGLGEVCSIATCGSTCASGTTACGSGCFNLSTDASNCGACGRVCPIAANARGSCSGGACSLVCGAGYGECDLDPSNGCETNLAVSTDHCGVCGAACPQPPNASAACMEGVCGLGACRTGYADCDRDHRNGCEVSLLTTVSNCGACGNTCVSPANASSACLGGVCGIGTCMAGFGNCDGAATNGCETTLATSREHCGACGNACPAVPNATATCGNGTCGFTCMVGFGNCDGVTTNGCETNLASSVAHCGTCDAACPTPPNGSATCTGAGCGLGACSSGFGNCDGIASNGCEAALATSSAHCGACGVACPVGTVCSGGSCASICSSPNVFCAGSCHNPQSDVAHCGSCNNLCPTPSNATPSCEGGACGFACNAGMGNCDGSAANGCESSFGTSLSHCGRCGNACVAPSGAAPTCTGGTCGFVCMTGMHECGGACVSNNSAATCGALCSPCPAPANGVATCESGACGFVCAAGFVRVGSVCVSDGTCPAAPSFPTVGLLGAYEFELDGRDASGARNHGTVVDPVAFVAGRFCRAASFNGSSGSIDLPDRRLATVTVSARVRWDGMAIVSQPIVDAWTGDENFHLSLDSQTGVLRYSAGFHHRIDSSRVYPEIHTRATNPVVQGEWHSVAMSYDGSTLRLYVDGVEQPSITTNRSEYPSSMASLPDIRVGRSVRGGMTANISIDHLLIYDRALSATEISAL